MASKTNVNKTSKHKKVELYLGKNVAADLCFKKFHEAKVSLKFSSSVDFLNWMLGLVLTEENETNRNFVLIENTASNDKSSTFLPPPVKAIPSPVVQATNNAPFIPRKVFVIPASDEQPGPDADESEIENDASSNVSIKTPIGNMAQSSINVLSSPSFLTPRLPQVQAPNNNKKCNKKLMATPIPTATPSQSPAVLIVKSKEQKKEIIRKTIASRTSSAESSSTFSTKSSSSSNLISNIQAMDISCSSDDDSVNDSDFSFDEEEMNEDLNCLRETDNQLSEIQILESLVTNFDVASSTPRGKNISLARNQDEKLQPTKINFSSGEISFNIHTNDVVEADTTIAEEEELIIQDQINFEDNNPNFEENNSPFFETNIPPIPDLATDPYARCTYGQLEDELNTVDDKKCIASFDLQLKRLVGNFCRHPNCSSVIVSIVPTYIEYTMKLEWHCMNGHRDYWYSSPIYAHGFAVNYLTNGALLLSGGQFHQFRRFCRFLQLGNPSASSFYRNQRLYVSPTVQQEYDDMEQNIIQEMKKKDNVILCGDCQLDSPGWSATKGTYTIMDHDDKKLVMMCFGDKREVNLKSTKLEVHLFMKSMKYLINEKNINVSEICTDAHSTIKKLMRTDSTLTDVHHSLDVWHKAGKISKKLVKRIAKKKQLQPTIGPWIPSIRNHFWYSCGNCDRDEVKMRVLWLNVLKHICDDHSDCDHKPLDDENRNGKPWLDADSIEMDIIREHVMNPQWLKSFAYYTRYRHTGLLEAFHNLVLTYCPKRIGYKNDAYITRHQLAYIDFNTHLDRPQMKRKNGEPVWVRKYGKRTKEWFVSPVPDTKTYPYLKSLLCKMLWRRHMDLGDVCRTNVARSCTKTLHPHIGQKDPPSMEELLERHVRRSEMKVAEI